MSAFYKRLFTSLIHSRADSENHFRRTIPFPYLKGANLPWVNYGGDFGANAWNPAGGIGRPGQREELHRYLLEIKDKCGPIVRWFLFCDGRAGVRFDAEGAPIGPDDHLYTDMDAALETTVSVDMKIIFVLFDFHWFDQTAWVNSIQTGGRREVISGSYKQRKLRRHLLIPLFERYGHSPAILAWDIINEPEWVTRGWGATDKTTSISPPTLRRFIKKTTRLIHRHTDHMVTVGLGNASGLHLVQGCGLDFFQVHWYDQWEKEAPLTKPLSELNLDRPVLLGEFPTKNSARLPDEIIAASRSSGYCGALGWSLLANDHFSDLLRP